MNDENPHWKKFLVGAKAEVLVLAMPTPEHPEQTVLRLAALMDFGEEMLGLCFENWTLFCGAVHAMQSASVSIELLEHLGRKIEESKRVAAEVEEINRKLPAFLQRRR